MARVIDAGHALVLCSDATRARAQLEEVRARGAEPEPAYEREPSRV